MKTWKWIGLMLTGGILSGCVSNQSEEDFLPQEVTFQVVQAPVSKAITSYPTTLPFKAYAYFLPVGKKWDSDKKDAEFYISGDIVEYDNTNNTWHTSTTYYWPKQGSLTFFACSPVAITEKTEFAHEKDGFKLTQWDVTETGNAKIDFMTAEIVKDKQGNENTYGRNGVPTCFHHRLARVNVKAKLDADYGEDKKVILKKVEMTKIYTIGDYHIDQWNNQSGQKDIMQYDSVGIELTSTAKDIGIQGRMMIPQALYKGNQAGDAGAQFRVTYEEITSNNNIETQRTTHQKDIIIWEATEIWGIGKEITYTLIVNLGTSYIEFDTNVTDWTKLTDSELTLE